MKTSSKRAIIIEKMPCHQEIIPSWVWALTAAGYQVDVLANAPVHRNISSQMRDLMSLKFRTLDPSKPVNLASYNLVLNNSMYPDGKVEHMKPHRKTLSVLHRLPKSPTDYADVESLRNANHQVLALGDHMHQALQSANIPSLHTSPVFFGPIPGSLEKVQRCFLVQGTMERFRRNYGCLVDLVNDFGTREPAVPVFEIRLIGDGGRDVLDWLAPQVDASCLDRVNFVLNADYDRYLAEVRAAGWMMPCVDESYEHEYFDRKITSGIMLAVGNGTPPLLHQRLADLYGFRHGIDCLTYGNAEGSLAAAFHQALEMSPADYTNIVRNLMHKRNDWLQTLRDAFATL